MKGIPWPMVKMYFWFRGLYLHLHHFFIPLLKKKNDPKVFCIGDVKTGTSTLAKALSILGYRSIQMVQVKKPKEGWIHYVKNCNYDAFSDWPMRKAGFYKELNEEFPNSKFILTLRETKSWSKSFENYFKASPWEINKPQDIEQRIKNYERRNKEILEYFKDKPSRLLIVELVKGDGWTELCKFLDKPIPDKPFPHKNKGKYKKKTNVAE
jgi:hypothetical protein